MAHVIMGKQKDTPRIHTERDSTLAARARCKVKLGMPGIDRAVKVMGDEYRKEAEQTIRKKGYQA